VTVGVEGVRAGVIGEIGTSAGQMLNAERKVFEAAAIVHTRTGVPIYTHTSAGTLGVEQVDLLTAAGVAPSKIAVSHMDTNPDIEYQVAVARRGAFLSYDRVGHLKFASDDIRIRLVLEMVHRGYTSQLLLSHDMARLSRLAGRGGHGYSFLVDVFLPRLRGAGVDEATLSAITVNNPRSFYAFEPRGVAAA
jgi:phosphotriesterase-related protein